MLVLSRKQNQQILIGDDIKLTVLKIRGNSVRLGIEAPRSVHVVRGELALRNADREVDKFEVTVEFKNHDDEGRPQGSNLKLFPSQTVAQAADAKPEIKSPLSVIQKTKTLPRLGQILAKLNQPESS